MRACNCINKKNLNFLACINFHCTISYFYKHYTIIKLYIKIELNTAPLFLVAFLLSHMGKKAFLMVMYTYSSFFRMYLLSAMLNIYPYSGPTVTKISHPSIQSSTQILKRKVHKFKVNIQT